MEQHRWHKNLTQINVGQAGPPKISTPWCSRYKLAEGRLLSGDRLVLPGDRLVVVQGPGSSLPMFQLMTVVAWTCADAIWAADAASLQGWWWPKECSAGAQQHCPQQ